MTKAGADLGMHEASQSVGESLERVHIGGGPQSFEFWHIS